ncbi:MAG TPA: hypothetical protein PKB10_09950 [Tepidisphaeraceae bacterium]|nr:hypothetical protein [Tepidisphaeraceae bacterium]
MRSTLSAANRCSGVGIGTWLGGIGEEAGDDGAGVGPGIGAVAGAVESGREVVGVSTEGIGGFGPVC